MLAHDGQQLAQNGNNQSENEQQSHFQFFKYWYKDAKLMFQPDAAERARLAVSYAHEEIETIEELYENDRYENAFVHCERYQKYLEQVTTSLENAAANTEEDIDLLLAQVEEIQLRFQDLMAQLLEACPDAEEKVIHAMEHSHHHIEQLMLNTMGNKELLKYRERAILASDNVSDSIKVKFWRITNRNMTMIKYQQKNSSQSDNISCGEKFMIKERTRVHSDNATVPQQYHIKKQIKSGQHSGTETAPGQQNKIAIPDYLENDNCPQNKNSGKGHNNAG